MNKISKIKFIVIVFFISIVTTAQNNLKILKSNKNVIDYGIDGDIKKNGWRLDPSSKPDIYSFFSKKTERVAFVSDVDSISFSVKPNDEVNFIVLLNNKDTCYTQIKSINRSGLNEFTKEYKKINNGKYKFLVPEVHELVYIMIALTNKGLTDENLISKETPYYKDVIKHFSSFKDEPVIKEMNKIITDDWIGYYNLKMNACGYYYDKNNKIIKDNTYYQMGFGTDNFKVLEKLIPQVEAFGKKTNFRKFYAKNKTIYNEEIEKLKLVMPIDKQWKWLENNFPARYNHLVTTFSPLVGGSHATQVFDSKDFKEIMMFVCGPRLHSSNKNKFVEEGLMTRIVFTEIDHNYVNPITSSYNDQVNQAMSNFDIWVDKSVLSSYSNQFSIFNEYMTWAVFTLYCYDTFQEDDFNEINNVTKQIMVNGRGFLKFKEFNNQLLEIYKNRKKTERVADLYDLILKWCASQTKS